MIFLSPKKIKKLEKADQSDTLQVAIARLEDEVQTLSHAIQDFDETLAQAE